MDPLLAERFGAGWEDAFAAIELQLPRVAKQQRQCGNFPVILCFAAGERATAAPMAQTLPLSNAGHIQQRTSAEEVRCHQLAESTRDPSDIGSELYLTCFSRPPTTAELESLTAEFDKPETDRRKLIEDIVWAMVNSPEFLYLD